MEARRSRNIGVLPDDGGAADEGVGSLPTMGMEEAAVVCTANLERKPECGRAGTGRAAACVITQVLGLVDGFVDVDGLLRADNVMSNPNPKAWEGSGSTIRSKHTAIRGRLATRPRCA